MQFKATLFLFMFIPMGALTAFSQEEWTLDRCIEYALENNIRIRQQTISTQVSENNFKQSKIDIYPNLNASASHGISFGRALDQTTYQFTDDQTVQSSNMSLSSNVTLFNGFLKHSTIKQNEFNFQAELKDLERLKNDISLNIAAAYLQILFNKEFLEVSKSQLEITSLQVDRTRMLVDAGSVPMGTLLEMQAQEASEEVQVINAENQLDLSYLTLMQILDLDLSQPFAIVIPEIESISEEDLLSNTADIYETALAIQPQIKGSEYRLKSAETFVKVAKAYRSPRLSLSANYGSGYSDIRQRITGVDVISEQIGTTVGGDAVFAPRVNPIFASYPFFDQLKDNASTSLFLSLSIPIFNNRQITTNIKNAELGVLNSKLELEFTKKALYEDITRSYTDALAAIKKFNASEKALTAMEESFKYTNEKYELGLVNAVDFSVAKNQLLRTQSELLHSKYDFIFKTNILNFYRGRPIKI
jgi:outer membrane protein